ncbi:MAG: Asp-tRNA(Asn)/Glu-tRNA(Gln) amidotransferase subunit GatC [Gammaproteobacteria bacterium]|nr:Asp-tRNA(Asn)/Glu-tRNA(Gln) amidotransferase subunit GatC [Gammaproteobacteria bacterium]
MALGSDEVKKIAHLARLEISDADVPEYAKNLSNILDFVEQMNSVDTSDVAPMAHPLELPQRLRADEATEENQRELFQSVAPQVEAGLFLVPKVIE